MTDISDSAWRYTTKEDSSSLQSMNHPDLRNVGAPITKRQVVRYGKDALEKVMKMPVIKKASERGDCPYLMYRRLQLSGRLKPVWS